MRKKTPIIILIALQLVFALSLTAVKPVNEWMLYNLGETFTFETSRLLVYYDEFYGTIDFYADIKEDYSTGHGVIGRYGIISTDKNGISKISEVSQSKPRTQPYIESFYEPFVISSCSFHAEISPEAYEALDFEFDYHGASLLGFDTMAIAKSSHNITVKAIVYKGEFRYQGIFVDGIPIEEFISIYN